VLWQVLVGAVCDKCSRVVRTGMPPSSASPASLSLFSYVLIPTPLTCSLVHRNVADMCTPRGPTLQSVKRWRLTPWPC
jgi:hypothetical protein